MRAKNRRACDWQTIGVSQSPVIHPTRQAVTVGEECHNYRPLFQRKRFAWYGTRWFVDLFFSYLHFFLYMLIDSFAFFSFSFCGKGGVGSGGTEGGLLFNCVVIVKVLSCAILPAGTEHNNNKDKLLHFSYQFQGCTELFAPGILPLGARKQSYNCTRHFL